MSFVKRLTSTLKFITNRVKENLQKMFSIKLNSMREMMSMKNYRFGLGWVMVFNATVNNISAIS